MEIEFIETINTTELIPCNLLDKELEKKVGEKVALRWYFKRPSKREIEEEGAEMQQRIIIIATNKFSDKLDELFFKNLCDKFDLIYDYDFNQTYELLFQLHPISPPNYSTRMSWWDSKIICMEFSEASWKIIFDKSWYYGELFNDDVIKFGELKIKNCG